MNKLFYLLVVTAFALSSCGGNTTPTATLSPTTRTPVTQTPTTQVSITLPSTTQAPPTSTIVNPPNCTNSASFVTDVTVPDNTNFKQGEAFHKVWRVKNTGTCTWTDQYTLIFFDGDQMGAPNSLKLGTTKPGDTLDITVDMTAPSKDAIYRANFQMFDPSGTAMPIDQNTKLWVIVAVASATTSSGSGSASSGGGSGTGSSSNASGLGLVTSNCAFTVDQTRVNQTVDAINAYRAQNGVPAYVVNADLVTAAQSHSEDMACNKLFLHTGSNGSTPASRVASTGYVASSQSENVYGSYPPLTPQGAVTWWATDQIDPRHNENLVSTKFTQIGVGYAFFNNYGYYVIDFASP